MQARRAGTAAASSTDAFKAKADFNAAQARKDLDKAARKEKKRDEGLEQPDTTIEELWEILARGQFSLDVADFIDAYKECERKGLSSDIAEVIPQQVAHDDVSDLQHLSLSQVAYLIFCLMDGEDDRKTILQRVREQSFGMMDYKDIMLGRHDDVMKLKHFKQVISCLSQLLQIDEPYIISWFVWHLRDRFEMPETLYTPLMARMKAQRRGAAGEDVFSRLTHAKDTEANLESVAFTRNDWTRLYHAMQLGDVVPWERAQSLFDDTLRQLASLLAKRAETRLGIRLTQSAVDKKALEKQLADKCFIGRTQMTILFHTLYSALPVGMYRNPIELILAYIKMEVPEAPPEDKMSPATSPRVGHDTPVNRVRARKNKRAQTVPVAKLAGGIEAPEEIDVFIQELKDRFHRVDYNGDGFLDFDELKDLLTESNPDVSEEDCRSIFENLDDSGDGLIAFHEFIHYISPEKPEASAMKAQFDKLDLNGDGILDFGELCSLLQSGNPTIKEHEVRMLFDEADLNDDGLVDFNEFVTFLFNMDGRSKSTAKKTKQAASVAKKERERAETELANVKQAFDRYGGREEKINGNALLKICQDSGLFDSKFAVGDTDVIFAKVSKKGERKIGLKQFKAALKMISEKKGCLLNDVHDLVAHLADEPSPITRATTTPVRRQR